MPRGIRKPTADRGETAAEALERARREMEALQASMADLEAAAAREVEELAKRGPRAVALIGAFKAVIAAIKAELPGVLPDEIAHMAQQRFPKEKLIGRRYKLSQTQTSDARQKGEKAIDRL